MSIFLLSESNGHFYVTVNIQFKWISFCDNNRYLWMINDISLFSPCMGLSMGQSNMDSKKRKEKIAGSGPLVHILELISESTFLKIVFQNKNIDPFFVLN